ncbi:MAG TPA: ATP-dependent DNA helicase RecQ [Bacteroidales bacterium]|nr:ATP-dependent DNA helicase RecQ [Bacteroidales bacterium]
MEYDIYKILNQYWGYFKFRPLQEEVIQSVLSGKDTLALMPTGGGKSLTFQVPALAQEGICLVVTPLISLMKDQVENLLKKEIKAISIHSGMTRDEIDIALNNCLFGGYKFLYVSPERLATEIFKVRVQKMKVNLIAVDEAHCISQWGYDFRPSYLKIADLRDLLPGVPVLALTATAKPVVCDDIMQHLRFAEPNKLSKSFERTNLAYIVRQTDDKMNQLLRIFANVEGSGIVYVRNRRKAKEIALFLKKQGISANYYHAGLTDKERAARQDEWKSDFTRIMVATNAFGMGIDKPDVRVVVHIEPADSVESYFQEAGRAGRDEKKAFAILLCDKSDRIKLENSVDQNFPEIPTIKGVYQALGNFLRVPVGGGKDLVYDFNFNDFVSTYKFQVITAYNSLRTLQREGYIEYNEDVNNPSKVHFIVNRDDLYKFQVANAAFDGFIKLLLRSYTGIFTDYVSVDEQVLARRAKVSPDVIFQFLSKLSTHKIISYIPHKHTPLITYTEERLDDKTLYIAPDRYRKLRENYGERITEVINYAFSNDTCRSQLLLGFFGQTNAPLCGSCDVCIKKTDAGIKNFEFIQICDTISKIISEEGALPLQNLANRIAFSEDKVVKCIRWLLDNDLLYYLNDDLIDLKK